MTMMMVTTPAATSHTVVDDANSPALFNDANAVDPPPPPPASFLPCRRIKTNVEVFNPTTGQVEIADDIIILQPSLPPVIVEEGDDINALISSSSQTTADASKFPKLTSGADVKTGERAYWIRRTLREGKFGRIRYAIALRRRSGTPGPEWEVTDIKVAIKKYSLEILAQLQGKIAEDPIKGIAARQYMACRNAPPDETFEARAQRAVNRMVESHIVTPIDCWLDNEFVWQIMPYCGAELFEVLHIKEERFTESDARYWMQHILKALDFLHNTAGICHRDLRPENLLLHEESKSLVLIDFGVCLLLPHNDQPIKPQGTCGTLPYVAPEIASNCAFDGRAVDLWQAGVILFVMLTGSHPWERPDLKDVRFKLISEGYMEQMMRNHNLGLSAEAWDLLQSMLRMNPSERLTLEQIRDHAWMKIED